MTHPSRRNEPCLAGPTTSPLLKLHLSPFLLAPGLRGVSLPVVQAPSHATGSCWQGQTRCWDGSSREAALTAKTSMRALRWVPSSGDSSRAALGPGGPASRSCCILGRSCRGTRCQFSGPDPTSPKRDDAVHAVSLWSQVPLVSQRRRGCWPDGGLCSAWPGVSSPRRCRDPGIGAVSRGGTLRLLGHKGHEGRE